MLPEGNLQDAGGGKGYTACNSKGWRPSMKRAVVFHLVGAAISGAIQVSSPATDMFKDELNNRRDDHMDRWTWMMARIYAPAVVALVVGLLLMLPLGMIRETPLLAGIYAVARWAPALAIAASVILGLIATVTLWRWDQGRSQLVCECGGLLGRERPGRFGAYRKCLACSRNVNEKNYT